MRERFKVAAATPVRRARHAAAMAALLFASVTACRGTRESDDAATRLVDRGPELAALRERLDKLTQRIDALYEQQATRLVAVEMRASQLETRQFQAEQEAGEVKSAHAELTQLRSDIAALGAEQSLDQMYRARIDRLERSLAAADGMLEQPQSVDEIWRWYVAQRDEIRRLGQQLHPMAPLP